MSHQFYHPEIVRFTFVLGIVVSIFFYEKRQLTTGGIAVPGYLAFAIFEPAIVPAVLASALATYLIIHKLLPRIALLGSSMNFALTILTSAGLHLVVDIAFLASSHQDASSNILRGVGYVVPGLIAHDFARHGVLKTTLNIGLTSAMVAVALAAAVILVPQYSRMMPSPVQDVFPIDLAFMPLLVFTSLIAWLGVVRLHDLRCGGFLGGAFLTMLVLQPSELLRFAVTALIALAIVKLVLDPIAILFGRRRFAAHMVIGASLSWFTLKLTELYFSGLTISVVTPSLAVIGVLVTGLISSDMDSRGILRTATGSLLSVSFTLTGTLLMAETATLQRAEVILPLLAIFIAGSAVLAFPAAKLSRIMRQLRSSGAAKEA